MQSKMYKTKDWHFYTFISETKAVLQIAPIPYFTIAYITLLMGANQKVSEVIKSAPLSIFINNTIVVKKCIWIIMNMWMCTKQQWILIPGDENRIIPL